jgi:predicted N-acetyltransferase YhbS
MLHWPGAMKKVTERIMRRDEVELVRTIDRSELIEKVFHLVDGVLELRPERYDMQGWPAGELEKITPHLLECFDAGGWFLGAFDGPRLIGIAVLGSRFIGRKGDQLQLVFLHVSASHRREGIGRRLFEAARAEAHARGAARMYISATPSENTIHFYLRAGCEVCREPDPGLLAKEPDDIHLVCRT